MPIPTPATPPTIACDVDTGNLEKVASDTNVAHFRKYYAIGSGADYALGAVHACFDRDDDPAALASLGVASAINFDTYCGGEIEVYEVPD